VNALADDRVADYLNENFVCTYLKVGTFQIVNVQKQGGNVASYFCQGDGGVLHAVPGQVNADKLLAESRWAYETRKSAATRASDLAWGTLDTNKFKDQVIRAHAERYHAEQGTALGRRGYVPVPAMMPRHASQQAQAHWLLARQPLAKLDVVYPIVWVQILNEELSGLPVEKR
jgi:hypothetical protein